VRDTTLDPDGETTLALSMMMHRGMEGPHLFRVTVPIVSGGESGLLAVFVRADFR
jgi:hypothetical protein